MRKYRATKKEIAARNVFTLRCCIRALELIASEEIERNGAKVLSPAEIARAALLAADWVSR